MKTDRNRHLAFRLAASIALWFFPIGPGNSSAVHSLFGGIGRCEGLR